MTNDNQNFNITRSFFIRYKNNLTVLESMHIKQVVIEIKNCQYIVNKHISLNWSIYMSVISDNIRCYMHINKFNNLIRVCHFI